MTTVDFLAGGSTLAALNHLSSGTLNERIGMVFTALGRGFLRAEMPADARTRQPYGLLHGGASAAMIETLGSVASGLLLTGTGRTAVGLEIHANHVRAVRSGVVTGEVRPLHAGGSTHVWRVRIVDTRGRVICDGGLTCMVLDAQE